MSRRGARKASPSAPVPADGEGPRPAIAPPSSAAWLGAALIALAAAGAAAALSLSLFAGLPRVTDEVSYALQGRIFASGRVSLPPPAVPAAFDVGNVILTAERWCSKYPPGFPLLLAAGWLVSAPWLVNPLLFGLAALGVFRLGATLHGARTGLLASLLFASLPFGLLQGAGFMAHVACLAPAAWALALLAAPRGGGGGGRRLLVLSGALAGFAFVVRPASALFLLALPAALLFGQEARREGARRALRSLAFFAAGAAVPLALLLALQAATFGSPFRSGYRVADPSEGFLGNSSARSGVLEILDRNVRWYADALPRALWAVPGPPFWWLLPLLAKRRREDLVPFLAAAGLVAGYQLYFFHDWIEGGPRFCFEATGFLALLLARSLVVVGEALAGLLPAAASFRPAAVSAAGPLLGAALAVLTVVRAVPDMRFYGWSYMGVPKSPMAGAAEAGLGEEALVLVDFEDTRGIPDYGPANSPGFFPFLFLNDVDPARGRRVFVRALPGREAELRRAYPRRETWRATVRFTFPTVEEAPFPGPCLFGGITWRREPGASS